MRGSDFSQTATGMPKPCFFFLMISTGSRLRKARLNRYRFCKPFTFRSGRDAAGKLGHRAVEEREPHLDAGQFGHAGDFRQVAVAQA